MLNMSVGTMNARKGGAWTINVIPPVMDLLPHLWEARGWEQTATPLLPLLRTLRFQFGEPGSEFLCKFVPLAYTLMQVSGSDHQSNPQECKEILQIFSLNLS